MMASSLIPGCQVISDLLTIREKGVLITVLEPRCTRAKLLWEQEIYIPFKYTASRPYFHTFPAEVCQVGLNFANEDEAEEFHHAVKTVCDKMTNMVDMTTVETVSSSSSDKPPSGNESIEKMNEEKDSTVNAPSILSSPSTSSFKELDPTMRRLLIQAKLSKEDLKEKNVAEAVDCIINKFGGLKAVQRELRTSGAISQTLPRATGTSIALALQKRTLERVPSISSCTFKNPGDAGKP
ncbi:neural Wiskott-Aldrich syndrome protein isoform X2 [Melanotaenia boesemani]|uniref:neural Wiskott-Aldrich syndrome protein isoform X2 n=1 Tax=Melanotaenia boesemani TaxID=1250792 RepID=UPI001C054047|nr:neural Wiskott-Aldrich syndrome protein isoform X2 [Melanotaenia boesemani]